MISVIICRLFSRSGFLSKYPVIFTAKRSLQDHCVNLLKEGELLGVAPGGSKEGIFVQVSQAGNRLAGRRVDIPASFQENLRTQDEAGI